MTIRPMLQEDCGAVARLSAQLGYPVERAAVEGRLADLAGRPDHAFYVGEGGGEILGWVHAYSVGLLESSPYAEVGGLVVDASQRRLGVGRALVERALAWTAEHGLRELRLRSGVHREEAHAFYRALGFEESRASILFRRAP